MHFIYKKIYSLMSTWQCSRWFLGNITQVIQKRKNVSDLFVLENYLLLKNGRYIQKLESLLFVMAWLFKVSIGSVFRDLKKKCFSSLAEENLFCLEWIGYEAYRQNNVKEVRNTCYTSNWKDLKVKILASIQDISNCASGFLNMKKLHTNKMYIIMVREQRLTIILILY